MADLKFWDNHDIHVYHRIIAVARKDYNDQVAVYNKKVKRFPGALIAGITGFDEKEYFKADPNAKEAPKVDFGGNE
jgi:LemA protein